MSDDAVKDNMNLMLFAGHDTSSTTMSMVLKYLYLNPECLTEVIQGAPFCLSIYFLAFWTIALELNSRLT